MDRTQLALLALFVGVVIGGVISIVVFGALRARDRARLHQASGIPGGMREVLHGMDDAAVVVDASGTVIAASAPASAFGLRESSILPSDDLRALMRRARDTDLPATENLRLRRGAAYLEPRSVAARATRVAPQLTLIVLRDITERERIEQMRRDFVANTSHELKTPVGAVSLLSEAIESASDDPEQVRHFASRLTAEATRLAQLTARIMSLSRLQSTDELTEDRIVSIDEIVAAAVDAHVIQADAAGTELVRGGERGAHVRGDAQILAEAVGNLLANAIAYSPRGSSVGIGIKVVEDVVEIAVTDRGVGIPEGDQDRLFERFYRADQSRARRTGGTGLGLSIVKHAVQRHGGEVRLWSRPGRGSTFTIRLPLASAPADTPKPKRLKTHARDVVPTTPAQNGEPA